MALLISLPLGILAALKRHSFVDNLCTLVAVAGQADADLLARHHADHHLRGAPPAAARLRLRHLAALPRCPPSRLGAFLAPITMRLVRSGVIEVHEHGVHQDRARQGHGRVEGGGQARLPQRVHPGHHRARAAVRPAPGRRHRHRDRVRVARASPPSRWTRSATRTSRWSSARWCCWPCSSWPSTSSSTWSSGSSTPASGPALMARERPRPVALAELGDAPVATPERRAGDPAAPLAAALGPGRRRHPPPDRRQRRRSRPWIAPHSPLAVDIRHRLGAARVDGGRQARPLARHRPDRPRPALAHDLRRPRLAGDRGRRGAHLGHHRGAARARGGLLRRPAPTGRS